jgi:hypothetical protein
MKKKHATNGLKLQLNRETLQALQQSDLEVIQGGGTGTSGLNSCPPCNTRYGTCLC